MTAIGTVPHAAKAAQNAPAISVHHSQPTLRITELQQKKATQPMCGSALNHALNSVGDINAKAPAVMPSMTKATTPCIAINSGMVTVEGSFRPSIITTLQA
mmetsp:Transcript_52755/g.104803  ORF Transcript_52755/g.104803 Transcript_52755/m.104803 type:complete len:101 (+) Transcript_52755:310-612(+)